MNEKVSVIVPAYNCEMYINRVIKSIEEQTYKNIELIIINDGSNDRTSEIIEENKKKFDNIIYITKENTGVSATRNVGIENAKGNYIVFVDADDYIEKDMIEEMYRKLEESKADVAVCSYSNVTRSGEEKVIFPWDDGRIFTNLETKKQIMPLMIENYDGEMKIWGTAWRMLIKKEKLKSIRFNESVYMAEDLLFTLELYSKCDSIITLNKCYYKYCNNSNSSMQKYNENFYNDSKKYHRIYLKLLEDIDIYKENVERYQISRFGMYTTNISNEVRSNNKWKNKLNKIKIITRDFKNDELLLTINEKNLEKKKR